MRCRTLAAILTVVFDESVVQQLSSNCPATDRGKGLLPLGESRFAANQASLINLGRPVGLAPAPETIPFHRFQPDSLAPALGNQIASAKLTPPKAGLAFLPP